VQQGCREASDDGDEEPVVFYQWLSPISCDGLEMERLHPSLKLKPRAKAQGPEIQFS
jgi:hypothetical protein